MIHPDKESGLTRRLSRFAERARLGIQKTQEAGYTVLPKRLSFKSAAFLACSDAITGYSYASGMTSLAHGYSRLSQGNIDGLLNTVEGGGSLMVFGAALGISLLTRSYLNAEHPQHIIISPTPEPDFQKFNFRALDNRLSKEAAERLQKTLNPHDFQKFNFTSIDKRLAQAKEAVIKKEGKTPKETIST